METGKEVKPVASGQPPKAREELALIPLGIALNLALGLLVHTLKIPLYIDAVGTVVITLLAGMRAGILVGVVSFAVWGIFNPVYFWFAGTQAAIAIYTHLMATRGAFRTWFRTILAGVGLGIVAGVVSAPVIVALFGGITGSGASVVVAFLVASGKGILKSVILSGMACEPIDKTIQCLLAVWLIKGLPQTLLRHFRRGSLEQNDFIRREV